MDELNRRNTETVKETIKGMHKKIEEQQIRIDGLHSSVSTLINKVNELQGTINMLRALQMGSGPTSR